MAEKMSDLKMRWTSEMEINLIEEIHKRPNLWNPLDPRYSKRTLKKLGYEEVTEILRLTWPACNEMLTPGKLHRLFIH